ncbi:MAG: arsenosugar biosynthesis radical SAM protein ArsS [Acidobacteriota bacterium]|nr:arsenosugar biosynthesis radical SAM protein ArsS [Acidobacteriota bacterium]
MTKNPIIQIRPRNGKPALPLSEISFQDRLAESGLRLRAAKVEILQVNVGKLCNQACKHCHVDASPTRTEIISRETIDHCLDALRKHKIPTLDITGGAPELVPDFRYLVSEGRNAGARAMVRHNLTVMFEEGNEDLPEFFAANDVEVISSLPYFQARQTDAQRGNGVFEKSIEALRRLNSVGYGTDGSGLVLDLVYNPVGAYLPPEQKSIEADFKRELAARHNVVFNNLYTITNMPIARYLDWLRSSKNEDAYMQKLINAFNPATVEGLMCRNTLSVEWRGNLFDCDFNQMLEIGVAKNVGQKIEQFEPSQFEGRQIMTNSHCFGCTAGAGSSCGGTVS